MDKMGASGVDEMARQDRAELGPVSDEGDEVTRRRERLGLDMYELADEAGVSRHTVSAIEAGKGFRRISLTKIQNALDRIEAEVGMDAPPREETPPAVPQPDRRRRSTDVVIVRLKNDAGEVAVEGPVEDLEALRATATALLRALEKADPETDADL